MRRNRKASEEIKNSFENADKDEIPEIPELPAEKPREQRLLDQDLELKERNNAQNKQVSVVSCIPVDIFLARVVEEIGEYQSSSSVMETAFKEDMDSCKIVASSYDPMQIDLPQTAFDRLYSPRKLIYRTRESRQSFERNSNILERFMDQNDIARLPNAMKRIKKGESVNLRLPRYSAEQIKRRKQNGKDTDLFRHLSLLPYSLTKSNKSSYERKMAVLINYQEMMQDFNYSNRPGSKEREKLNDIQKKMSELEIFINTPRPAPVARSVSVPAPKVKRTFVPNEVLKRKAVSSDSDPAIPRKIERALPSTSSKSYENRENVSARRLSEESSSNEDIVPRPPKVIRNVDPSAERERLLREKRKEETIRREAEYMENQARAKEEWARQQAAARAEIERRNKEMERIRTEQAEKLRRQEEERKQEAIRRAEEYRKAQEREAELKRIQDEERHKIQVAEEFERLRRRMEEAAQEKGKTPQITVWRFLPVRKPSNWSKRKEKFFNHYNWPTDPAQREVERQTSPMASGTLIQIPHANNANTKVTPLTLPKFSLALKSSTSLASGTFKKPCSSVAVYRPADQNLLEKLVQEIKKLTGPSRRNLSSYISLTHREVNYQDIEIRKMRSSFMYPFYVSDGVYWPLLFTLEEPNVQCHVRSLTVCNSFSGKYASRYLLTTPLQEDSASKKFDAKYHNCSGDWAQYSQKPGRFSKRVGYKAHYSKSKDSFDVQKQRARDKLNSDYANERREQDEFGRYLDEFKQRGHDRRRNNEYKSHITTHLRQLVKDARLDIYSMRESDQDVNYDNFSHPGTRDCLVPLKWHMHGYRFYVRTRDRLYAQFMYKACARYEDLLRPRYSPNVDQFNEWCFTPMLCSLHYQSKYDPYDVFSTKETRELRDRYKRYHGLLRERKFSFKEAMKVCQLTVLDKKQFTILHDQLVSHFRDFPTISQLMYNKKGDMINKVHQAIELLMNGKYEYRSNEWNNIVQ